MTRRLSWLAGLGLLVAAVTASPALAIHEYHPEDEFNLHDWIPIHLGGLNLSVNKAVAYLWLGTALTITLGILVMRVNLTLRPGRRQTVGESVYEVVQTQIVEQGLPTKAIGRWFTYVASLFLYIFVLNLVGFVPLPLSDEKFHIAGTAIPTWGIYAVTSQLSVTLMLAILTVLFTHYEGFRAHGAKYPKTFIPAGVPRAMVPIMFILEAISHLFRIVSLSVRLYANMLAGHMLILLFIGLTFVLGTIFFVPVSIVFATVFYLFEVVIVVTIQAFIFSALTAIYIGSAIEPDH
jgi:F-type H+-transporting ATPase subunit a